MRAQATGSVGAVAAIFAAALVVVSAARADVPAHGAMTVAALGADTPHSSVVAPESNDRGLVLRIQRRLREIGLYRGVLDGVASPETVAAIREYQRQSGLEVDGKATRALLEDLQSASSEMRRLMVHLETVREEQITAARRALETHLPARELVSGVSGRASLERAQATDPESCFAAPSTACLLDVALAAAVAVGKIEFRDWAFGDVAVAQAAAGDGVGALGTAARMSDPRLVISALRRIARAQAEAGDFVGARVTAQAIPDIGTRAEAFSAVAAAEFAAGDAGAGQATLANALASVGAVPDPGRQSALFSEIAGVQAKFGDRAGAAANLDRALERALAVITPDERARALSRVAVTQADAGRPAAALATAKAIAEADQRTPALIRAAVAQAEAGNVSRGLTTAAAIDDARYRSIALQEVARIQARGGATTAARATLVRARAVGETIDYGFAHAYALSRVARAQADIGAIRDALETSELIDGGVLRARALWAVAASQMRLGDGPAARRSVVLADAATEEISDALGRVWMFGDVAVSRFKGGDTEGARAMFDRGLSYALSLSTPWVRARALSKLATTLVQMQRGPHASQKP